MACFCCNNFWHNHNADTTDTHNGTCKRYPKEIPKHSSDVCGEFVMIRGYGGLSKVDEFTDERNENYRLYNKELTERLRLQKANKLLRETIKQLKSKGIA